MAAKVERARAMMKLNLDERRTADESLLKNKKELELDKIKVAEGTRVDIEKSVGESG